jgi:hypothetical protein
MEFFLSLDVCRIFYSLKYRESIFFEKKTFYSIRRELLHHTSKVQDKDLRHVSQQYTLCFVHLAIQTLGRRPQFEPLSGTKEIWNSLHDARDFSC